MSSPDLRTLLQYCWNGVIAFPRRLAIGLVRFYQRGISPLIGPRCRFTPSCSQYMILAIEKYGLVGGCLRGLWRIVRCNPFNVGGHDPP